MDWDRTDAFGWVEFNFYDTAGNWIGNYIPKRDKVNIPNSVTKEELEFIYNVIRYR